ncbi:MAG: hypothetical protein K8I82_03860 [Anaerolineae bacterium]|nr:hypothetical protein [Anaerolineae bacterium]
MFVWILLVFTSVAQAQEEEFEPFLQTDLTVLTGDVQRPNGLYWHDGFIYTSCAGDKTVYRLDDSTGNTDTYITGVGNAHSLYVEDGPVIWAADFQSNALWRISHENGRTAVHEGLSAPWGIAPSATDDTFYITEWGSDNLINITRDGQVKVVASGFDDPSGLVVTEDVIYIANNGSVRRSVEWLTEDEAPQPLIIGLQKTTNITLGTDGLLYIAYALGTRGVVGRVDPEFCQEKGGCTNSDVELVLWTELPAPLAGLTITPDSRLFVHTMFGTEIYWLQLPENQS